MKTLILSTIVSAILTQAATAVDLTGIWEASGTTGGVQISFTQTGQTVEGTCTFPDETILKYGYVSGTKCRYGTFDGTTFNGKWLANYPVEFKTKCPSQWSGWSDMTLTISPDGKMLTGSRKQSSISYPSCLETDNSWENVSYTRKTPIVSTTPITSTNNCTATFNFNTGRLVIPNLAVSITQPFGGTPQVSNYDIEMQQRSGSFVFDLDLNKVVQR